MNCIYNCETKSDAIGKLSLIEVYATTPDSNLVLSMTQVKAEKFQLGEVDELSVEHYAAGPKLPLMAEPCYRWPIFLHTPFATGFAIAINGKPAADGNTIHHRQLRLSSVASRLIGQVGF